MMREWKIRNGDVRKEEEEGKIVRSEEATSKGRSKVKKNVEETDKVERVVSFLFFLFYLNIKLSVVACKSGIRKRTYTYAILLDATSTYTKHEKFKTTQ